MSHYNNTVSTIIIALVLTLIGGTSVLAEKSIPGDSLYSIKIHINEPAAGLFSFSKEDKAEWQERLVERRLDEAQKLISKNDLDEKTRLDLENKIKNQIEKFNNNISELAKEKGESVNSSDLNIRMQSSLIAYKSILENLSIKVNINADTKNETQKLISTISDNSKIEKQAQVNLVQDKTVTSQDNSISNTGNDLTSTTEIQKIALNLLNSAKLMYQKDKINLSVNIQNQINTKFANAENTMNDGDKFITNSDFDSATNRYQLVIDGANEIKLLITSNLIKSNIESQNGMDDEDDIEDDDFNPSKYSEGYDD